MLRFPGAHGRLRKIQLPLCAVQVSLALCAAGILTVAALASTDARMSLRVSDYHRLRREREALNRQPRRLKSAARQSSGQRGPLESLAI